MFHIKQREVNDGLDCFYRRASVTYIANRLSLRRNAIREKEENDTLLRDSRMGLMRNQRVVLLHSIVMDGAFYSNVKSISSNAMIPIPPG